MDVAELKPLTFLEGLNAEQLERLAQRCRLAHFRQNDRILTEGEKGEEWFGLLAGWVRFSRATPRGPVQLGKLGPGRYFGELALLGSGVRQASAEAETDCTCAVLGRQDFLKLLDEAPAVAEHVQSVAKSYQRQPRVSAL